MYNNYNFETPLYNDNSFVGYYVSSYNDVLNMAVPSNGSPVLFADLTNGMLWSKKIIQGIPTIQPYRIQPVYQEIQKPAENRTTDMMDEIKSLREEINILKGGVLNAKSDGKSTTKSA